MMRTLLAVASLDLSSAFYLVDTNLLIKQLKLVGLPYDVIKLMKAWLKNTSSYVSTDDANFTLYPPASEASRGVYQKWA